MTWFEKCYGEPAPTKDNSQYIAGYMTVTKEMMKPIAEPMDLREDYREQAEEKNFIYFRTPIFDRRTAKDFISKIREKSF